MKRQITTNKNFAPISKERYEKVCSYEWKQVNPSSFADQESWQTLGDIILHHPNPIVRHEASWIAGDLNIYDLIPTLISAVKHDTSIVGKHEAAEALGFIKGSKAKEAHDFLSDIINNPKDYEELVSHPDVIKTAEEAIKLLKKEIN